MARLRCPVCGRELEVRCADSPEPFTAYDPAVGLEAYGPLSVPKEVLHEGNLDGFRVLHLYFPATNSEHLVILPKDDGELHPLCRQRFEELEKAREAYERFCLECCSELSCDLVLVGAGEELCPGCPCEEYRDDCEEEEEAEDWVLEDEEF